MDAEVMSALRALGDDTRVRILQEIARAETVPYTRLESVLGLSKSTISHHIKVLATAGVVSVRRDGRRHLYAVNVELIQAISGFLSSLLPGHQDSAPAGTETARSWPLTTW